MPRGQHSCPEAMCPRKFSLNKNSYLDSVQKSLSRKGLLGCQCVLHSWAPCHGSSPVTTDASYLLAHHEGWEKVSHRRNKCLISPQNKAQGILNFLCSKEEFSKAYTELKKEKDDTVSNLPSLPPSLAVAALTCSRPRICDFESWLSSFCICLISLHPSNIMNIYGYCHTYCPTNWSSLFF